MAMKKVLKTKPKREYRAPKLQVYGDLTQMTKATNAMTKKNDHSGGKFKTT
jgi:hypothetical protein